MKSTLMSTPINDRWPSCEATHARLTVFTSQRRLAEVTALLDVAEATAAAEGDFVRSPAGGTYRCRSNQWWLESEGQVDSSDLRRHIEWVCQRVSRESLQRVRALEDVDVRLRCGWYSKHGHGGPVISPEQSELLVRLDLELEFDFYFLPDCCRYT